MRALSPRQLLGRTALTMPRTRPAHATPRSAPRRARGLDPTIALAPLKGASKVEIRKRVARFTAMFLIDDSGSMYGFWGDQRCGRYAAARSLLELLRRSGGGRAGVLHYGSDCPASLALAPVKIEKDRDRLLVALSEPQTLGGTNLLSALDQAVAFASTGSKSEEAVAYFILTDGIEPVSAAIRAGIDALGAENVHLLLVDITNGCTPAMESAWRALQVGSFTRLKTFDTRQMAEQLASIAATTLGLQAASTNSKQGE